MDSHTKSLKESAKKPFDKKKWRERKYSNKFKVQKWEEKRKRSVIREYYKDLKGMTPDASQSGEGSSGTTGKKKRPSALHQAKLEMERQREQKQQRREEIERQKEEREEALKQYRIKKAERFKRLSKKTRKGQPVMKDRLELLLEKIQKQCATDS